MQPHLQDLLLQFIAHTHLSPLVSQNWGPAESLKVMHSIGDLKGALRAAFELGKEVGKH
ncbi:hypothetical protein [Burkholderia pyrrocinia]